MPNAHIEHSRLTFGMLAATLDAAFHSPGELHMRGHSTVLLRFVRLVALLIGGVLAWNATALRAQETVPQPAPSAQTPPAPGRGRGPIPVDPRVQIRMHHFADTNEDIPYALFVSSKVKTDMKAPLIVTLHGLGGTHTTMMRPVALDLAEAGGYILLAPMGYNPRGWYGIPAGQRRGAPNPIGATAPSTNAAPTPGRQGPPRGALA